MTDASWSDLERFRIEQEEDEARWLAEGGSYLCAYCERHKPCRKHPTENENDSPPEENA